MAGTRSRKVGNTSVTAGMLATETAAASGTTKTSGIPATPGTQGTIGTLATSGGSYH
jgi:hypothetical protein